MVPGVSSVGQEPDGGVYCTPQRIVGAYSTKILTNIRVHIRDCMPKI